MSTNSPHFRRCRNCGHINRYSDAVIPECPCRRCGSADTNRMKHSPPLWQGSGVYIPQNVALCPECGDDLTCRANEWEAETGRPVFSGLEIECVSFLKDAEWNKHQYKQSDWQPVREAVAKWCDALNR